MEEQSVSLNEGEPARTSGESSQDQSMADLVPWCI